ncbi:MAG: tRNA (adenosine(37)-N6)-threonylcarbamoyltransferase complex ATPase subunit type 1 TsaE [Clostridiaceae bacterium]|jgi:tRNA threonylcarbamoyladenosine biosynthesis protein TsaE|nr:tRNA (adenosine(37)-N6)-threonylcarbamoyltransferase complex ATPase subunit type 1 TsaE [Clostridiaceae bacterium]
MQEYITKSERETIELGKKLAGSIGPGSIIALTGDLGTGKTIFVKGIAEGLSINDQITSPTFTLVHSYDGFKAALHHFDVYRVSDEDELFEIGFFEYLYSGDICVIEWADLVCSLIPPGAVWVHIERTGNDENIRRITIERVDVK